MKNAIKNNLFLFGYIKKYAFAFIPLIFISAIFQALTLILNVLGIKYVVDAVEQGGWLTVTLRAECLEEIGREVPLTDD